MIVAPSSRPRLRARTSPVAGAFVLALLSGAPSAHAGAAPSAPQEDAAAARAAVAAGRKAAAAGDFATALARFEEALALRPAPSLHFNIAVCHHNLMLAAAPGTEAYEAYRRAAIEAYGRYLDASPDAEDRASVDATIEELGGRSKTADTPWVIERIDPDDVPVAPSLRDAPEPVDPVSSPAAVGPTPRPPAKGEPADPHASATAPPSRHVGRIGLFVPVTLANLGQLARGTDDAAAAGLPAMRAVPGIGLGLRGAAMLGARRRVAVGGELWATGQPISSRAQPVLVIGTISPTVEYGHPLARGRLEIGGGGGLGIMLQTLRYVGDTPPPCSVSERGALSTRPGALLSGRFSLSALLGPRQNHELSLRISPGIAGFGPGTRAKDDDAATGPLCSERSTPFQSLGLSGRAALVVMIDLGYAPRF